jgi:hypothetical protein
MAHTNIKYSIITIPMIDVKHKISHRRFNWKNEKNIDIY